MEIEINGTAGCDPQRECACTAGCDQGICVLIYTHTHTHTHIYIGEGRVGGGDAFTSN